MQYILGAASQNAANARVSGPDADRAEVLDVMSTTWAELDPDHYPFTGPSRDRCASTTTGEQLLAGIDLVLAGVTARYPPDG